MPPKLALKRLTTSDMGFFRWYFELRPISKQKGINLNVDVFIGELYPSLPIVARDAGERFPINLDILGPGMKSELNQQRKILKSAKNWRLNGEFVANPPDDPERFNALAPDDFVVFEFIGDLFPNSAKAVFIASSVAEDINLHFELNSVLGNRSMITLTSQGLKQLIERSNPPDQHPIRDLGLDAEFEDAALGGIRGIRKLQSRPSTRKLSQASLRLARENANRIGQVGERYIESYLSSLKKNGYLEDYEWISDDNAISPYDFWVQEKQVKILVDVKSTETDFNNPIHISFNELLQMGSGSERYDLYRVFEIQDGMAQLRVAKNVGDFARSILEVFNGLPEGVTPDSISVLPSTLPFEPAISINLEDEMEE